MRALCNDNDGVLLLYFRTLEEMVPELPGALTAAQAELWSLRHISFNSSMLATVRQRLIVLFQTTYA